MSFEQYLNRAAHLMTDENEALQKEIAMHIDEMFNFSGEELIAVIRGLQQNGNNHWVHPKRMAAFKLLNSKGISSEEILSRL